MSTKIAEDVHKCLAKTIEKAQEELSFRPPRGSIIIDGDCTMSFDQRKSFSIKEMFTLIFSSMKLKN